MQKVMIVAHRSQSAELLETLQDAGIVQILDAERAMVTKEWPELIVEIKRHRSIEETMDRLEKAIDFLKPYSEKDPTSLFAPFVPVDASMYNAVVSGPDTMTCLGEIEYVGGQLEKLAAEAEAQSTLLAKLTPWQGLSLPVEELGGFTTSTTFVGLIADQHFDSACEKLTELGAAVEKVAAANRMQACVILCLNEVASDVHKMLRSLEFEAAAFEGLDGTVGENIARIQERLKAIQTERDLLEKQAADLAQILIICRICTAAWRPVRRLPRRIMRSFWKDGSKRNTSAGWKNWSPDSTRVTLPRSNRRKVKNRRWRLTTVRCPPHSKR